MLAVTGAAGSIGSEICRMATGTQLLLLDIDETRLFDIQQEVGGIAKLCDIRDERKMERILSTYRPTEIIHAAAYKHVPILEDEPEEAIETNCMATAKLLRAAEYAGVKRFVYISTDKAVDPSCVMGMTKALGERMVMRHKGKMETKCVRFGNVWGSRGSVKTIWDRQAKDGYIEVTDASATRYIMTIPSAAELVLKVLALQKGVYCLDMGKPVPIMDLAKEYELPIRFVGLRPGERLHEHLAYENEELEETGLPGILKVVGRR